ncbi:MAG: HAD family hydrolase [Bacteroidota bacterium]
MSQIGLIFDMDGVIVDNNKYHFLAWQKLGEKYGINISPEYYKDNMNGRTIKELIRTVFKDIPEGDVSHLGEEKEATYRDLYKDLITPNKGIMSLLDLAKKEGIPMVVGTSAPLANVEFTIDRLNLRDYFVDILDERAVTLGKPHPEIYLKCAKAINRDNANCIVFEDAVSGIKAGKAAGSKVVGVATSHSREELDADMVIDNFEGFGLQQIRSVLS